MCQKQALGFVRFGIQSIPHKLPFTCFYINHIRNTVFFKLSSSVFKLQSILLLTKLAPIIYFGSKYVPTRSYFEKCWISNITAYHRLSAFATKQPDVRVQYLECTEVWRAFHWLDIAKHECVLNYCLSALIGVRHKATYCTAVSVTQFYHST